MKNPPPQPWHSVLLTTSPGEGKCGPSATVRDALGNIVCIVPNAEVADHIINLQGEIDKLEDRVVELEKEVDDIRYINEELKDRLAEL